MEEIICWEKYSVVKLFQGWYSLVRTVDAVRTNGTVFRDISTHKHKLINASQCEELFLRMTFDLFVSTVDKQRPGRLDDR